MVIFGWCFCLCCLWVFCFLCFIVLLSFCLFSCWCIVDLLLFVVNCVFGYKKSWLRLVYIFLNFVMGCFLFKVFENFIYVLFGYEILIFVSCLVLLYLYFWDYGKMIVSYCLYVKEFFFIFFLLVVFLEIIFFYKYLILL